MTTLTETRHAGGFLVSEAQGLRSREIVTVASGQNLGAGAVLGRVTKRLAAAPIPTIVGTGSGAMTKLRFGPDAQVGSYVITLLETSATAAFSVVAPDGTALPNGAVGTEYRSNHLSFLISDGGTMTEDDSYTVVVTAGGTPVVVASASANGTIGSITLGKLAQLGTYKVVNVLAGTNTGTWDVIAPDGSTVGHGIIAAGAGGTLVFTSDHVNFTITDGTTDFALGDYFNILVLGYTSPQAKAWAPTAVDGTQEAWGILYDAVNASAAAEPGVAVVRDAEVNGDEIAWAATVTAAQKTEALRHLEAAGVIVR